MRRSVSLLSCLRLLARLRLLSRVRLFQTNLSRSVREQWQI